MAAEELPAPGLTPLRIRRREPLCAETRLELQRGLVTPSESFYVRDNLPAPAPPTALVVDGDVARPLRLSPEALAGRAERELVVTTECAGNGRAFMTPPVEGEQWSLGAVSTAAWRGVPLVRVLEEAGVSAAAVEVGFEGSDGFARSLPLEAARDPDILLATAMNGADLPHQHGGPLRLLVPRWYGMASVKWLSRITALREPFRGHFQVERYVIGDRPVRVMAVRAVITEPGPGTRVSGRARVAGYAWSGRGEIVAVEVSDDGGASWLPATLVEGAPPYAWWRWELDWRPRAAGEVTLLARATDSAGRVQPLEPVWNALGYENNAAVPVSVTVAPSRRPLSG